MFYGLELGKLKEYIYIGGTKKASFSGRPVQKITLKETYSVSCRSPFWFLWHLVCFVEDWTASYSLLLFRCP